MRAVALAGLTFGLLGCSQSFATTGLLISPEAAQDSGKPETVKDKDASLDTDILAMLESVSATNIKAHIDKLSSFHTRHLCSDDADDSDAIGGARHWIMATLRSIPGLNVEVDPFTFRPSLLSKKITRENVVAWIPGTGHPDRLIIVGGHYDSRSIDLDDATAAAPGANDSGSQTALLLEAARVMASYHYDATIVFITFAGEEQGLVGSKAFVEHAQKFFPPNPTIEAMLNCDIVGGDNTANTPATLQQFRLYSPGTPREIDSTGMSDDTSPSRGLMRCVASSAAAYEPSMTMLPMLREDRPDRSGDHEPFIDAGYPAVRFIETVESPRSGTAEGHQHSPQDLAAYVTPEYTARIARAVIATAASLARAPSPPTSFSVTPLAQHGFQLSWSPPAGGAAVHHYVVSTRRATDNLYGTHLEVPEAALSATVPAEPPGLPGEGAYFISVAAVDDKGHASLFAYPEFRCDDGKCAIQPGSMDVTSQR